MASRNHSSFPDVVAGAADAPNVTGMSSGHAAQAAAGGGGPSTGQFYSAENLRTGDSLGYLLKSVLASIRSAVETELQGRGLTFAQCMPLYKISLCKNTTLAALARELDTDPAAVTRLLDRMEAKDLIVRERSTTDRRVVHVRTTPLGEDMVHEVIPVLADSLNAHLADFSTDEWRQLVSLLQRLARNGEKARPQSA